MKWVTILQKQFSHRGALTLFRMVKVWWKRCSLNLEGRNKTVVMNWVMFVLKELNKRYLWNLLSKNYEITATNVKKQKLMKSLNRPISLKIIICESRLKVLQHSVHSSSIMQLKKQIHSNKQREILKWNKGNGISSWSENKGVLQL